ncbi:MAG: YceD family protein [Hyphomicrobiales bacterium]
MKREFTRPVDVSRLPKEGSTEVIEATPDERAVLAQRLELPKIHDLIATLAVRREGSGAIRVKGKGTAKVEQTCVLTLVDFETNVALEIDEVFRLKRGMGGRPDLVESFDDDDADLVDGDTIDLGELLAQELGMALDPYPKAPGASFEPQPER